MLVPDDDKDEDRPTIAYYPRCEVDETLRGGYCELSGEVGLKGLLVCERHARQIEVQDRIDLLEGIVACLGLCSRSIPLPVQTGISPCRRGYCEPGQPENSLALAKI